MVCDVKRSKYYFFLHLLLFSAVELNQPFKLMVIMYIYWTLFVCHAREPSECVPVFAAGCNLLLIFNDYF